MGSEKKSIYDSKKLAEIKKKLITRKLKLEDDLAELDARNEQPDSGMDLGDQVVSSSIEILKVSLQGSELEEYNMIVKALSMIEEGRYGFCLDCNKLISERRLQAYPNASRCLVCQEAVEENGGRKTA